MRREAMELLEIVGLAELKDETASSRSPTVSGAGWRSRAPWPPILACSSWMSRQPV